MCFLQNGYVKDFKLASQEVIIHGIQCCQMFLIEHTYLFTFVLKEKLC
jgi:hypothetical protein